MVGRYAALDACSNFRDDVLWSRRGGRTRTAMVALVFGRLIRASKLLMQSVYWCVEDSFDQRCLVLIHACKFHTLMTLRLARMQRCAGAYGAARVHIWLMSDEGHDQKYLDEHRSQTHIYD